MDNVATMIREGRIDEIERELQQREAEAATSADWHYARGRLLEAQGDTPKAVAEYRQALRITPEHSEATFRLAYQLDLHGQEAEALPLYESLARKMPTHVNVLLNLASIYEDHGRHEEALNCVDRVLSEYPNHPRARMFLKDIESSMNMFYDENQERSRVKRSAIMDTPIADFELSVRARNCLKKMNIHSLGDLLRISEPELMAYKNFGETSLQEIKAMLAEKGLQLGQMKEEAPRPARPPQSRRPLPDGAPEILNRVLSEIEFSSRARKCLERLNLVTLGDLVVRTEAELLAIKNFGQTSLSEVKAKLAEFNLSLRKPS
ncbi:MAG: tetratricopeptide repeat protein [Phycisphaerae bacterium]|nr:tetratricopeptide repeat protein [Phycisphaerae bacterium]